MRIFAKKSFKFFERTSGAVAKTRPLEFCDVPEWVRRDPLFILAQKEGSVEILENKQRQKVLELDPNAAPPANDESKKSKK